MIYLLTDNLLFSSKITGNLRNTGQDVRVFTQADALEQALAVNNPDVLLVNLSARTYDPVALIQNLVSIPDRPRIVAFCGHADDETRTAGLASGADVVVANSAITMNAFGTLQSHGILD